MRPDSYREWLAEIPALSDPEDVVTWRRGYSELLAGDGHSLFAAVHDNVECAETLGSEPCASTLNYHRGNIRILSQPLQVYSPPVRNFQISSQGMAP